MVWRWIKLLKFVLDFHFIELDEDLVEMIRMTQNPFESWNVRNWNTVYMYVNEQTALGSRSTDMS